MREELCIVFKVRGTPAGRRTLTTAQRKKRFRKKDQLQITRVVREEETIGLRIIRATKSSYKEHRVDALAPYAEEGRGKLRKATGSRKQAPIRRYPNGGTRQEKILSP